MKFTIFGEVMKIYLKEINLLVEYIKILLMIEAIGIFLPE
jgi:hypothetical protein